MREDRATFRIGNHDLWFTDSDVVIQGSLDSIFFPSKPDSDEGRLWLIHDHGVPIVLIDADSEDEAWIGAIDADKLEAFRTLVDDESNDIGYTSDNPGIVVHNRGCYDIEALTIVRLPRPLPFSMTAQFLEYLSKQPNPEQKEAHDA